MLDRLTCQRTLFTDRRNSPQKVYSSRVYVVISWHLTAGCTPQLFGGGGAARSEVRAHTLSALGYVFILNEGSMSIVWNTGNYRRLFILVLGYDW